MLSFFRSCLFCESVWVKKDLVCSFCWKKIGEHQSLSVPQALYPFKLYRLWFWNEESDFFLRKLMQALKGGYGFRALYPWTKKLSLKLLEESTGFDKKAKPLIFIPSPPINLDERDHAWCLASALVSQTGGKRRDLLMREAKETRPQKLKTKWQRKNLSLKLKNSSWKPSSNNSYIFVDDIITTGSTAQAAFKALKSPKSFVVCVLTERGRKKN